jgi:hypothetical protein
MVTYTVVLLLLIVTYRNTLKLDSQVKKNSTVKAVLNLAMPYYYRLQSKLQVQKQH